MFTKSIYNSLFYIKIEEGKTNTHGFKFFLYQKTFFDVTKLNVTMLDIQKKNKCSYSMLYKLTIFPLQMSNHLKINCV